MALLGNNRSSMPNIIVDDQIDLDELNVNFSKGNNLRQSMTDMPVSTKAGTNSVKNLASFTKSRNQGGNYESSLQIDTESNF